MEKTYQFDKFLTVPYMKDLVKRNGFKVVNEPQQDLEQTLQYYKHCLEASLQEPYIMTNDELIQIKIPLNQEEYYFMQWKVPKLKYLIARYKIPQTSVSIDTIKSAIQSNRSNNNPRADSGDNILLSYPPIANKFIILQGEKEVLEMNIQGQKTVNAYVIQPKVHLQATSRAVYRNLFAIHFNCSIICSYLAGQLSMDEAENRIVRVF